MTFTEKGQKALVNPKYMEQINKGNFSPGTPYREHIQSAMMTPAQRVAQNSAAIQQKAQQLRSAAM